MKTNRIMPLKIMVLGLLSVAPMGFAQTTVDVIPPATAVASQDRMASLPGTAVPATSTATVPTVVPNTPAMITPVVSGPPVATPLPSQTGTAAMTASPSPLPIAIPAVTSTADITPTTQVAPASSLIVPPPAITPLPSASLETESGSSPDFIRTLNQVPTTTYSPLLPGEDEVSLLNNTTKML